MRRPRHDPRRSRRDMRVADMGTSPAGEAPSWRSRRGRPTTSPRPWAGRRRSCSALLLLASLWSERTHVPLTAAHAGMPPMRPSRTQGCELLVADRSGRLSVGRRPCAGPAHAGAAAEPHSPSEPAERAGLPARGRLSPSTSTRTRPWSKRVHDGVGRLGVVLATVHGSCSLMPVLCAGLQRSDKTALNVSCGRPGHSPGANWTSPGIRPGASPLIRRRSRGRPSA
jgi:hypothetical protein